MYVYKQTFHTSRVHVTLKVNVVIMWNLRYINFMWRQTYIDFQICISVPFREKINLNVLFHKAGVKTFFQGEKNKFAVGISWFLVSGRLHLPFYFKTDLHLANCSRANVMQDFCVSAQSIIAWDQVELSASLSGKKTPENG